jgi:hypothetical protein
LDLKDEINVIHNKSEEIQEIVTQIGEPFVRGFIGQCGLNSTDILQFQNGADQLHNFSHELFDGYQAFDTDILSCSTMNPIYSSLMYDGKIHSMIFYSSIVFGVFNCSVDFLAAASLLFGCSTRWFDLDIFDNSFRGNFFSEYCL